MAVPAVPAALAPRAALAPWADPACCLAPSTARRQERERRGDSWQPRWFRPLPVDAEIIAVGSRVEGRGGRGGWWGGGAACRCTAAAACSCAEERPVLVEIGAPC